jgi:hypothetical protein
MTIKIKSIQDFINRINKLKQFCQDIKGFSLMGPCITLTDYLYNNINNPYCDSDYFEEIIYILQRLNIRQIRKIINNYIIEDLEDDYYDNKEMFIKSMIEEYVNFAYPDKVFNNLKKNTDPDSIWNFNWKTEEKEEWFC